MQRDFESDRYPDGIILLVERLDRLSREAPGQFFLWLSAMTAKGVTIATVDGARTYSGTLDMPAIIEVIVKASLANEESMAKSSRVASAWAGKRARLAAGDRRALTTRVPAWLTVTDDRTISVQPERAAIVKRIFEETVQGIGKHTIARSLNQDRIPTFGRSTAWHASYIQKILSSPAVIGEFQPGVKPRGAQRQTVDLPIQNYYPAVIDADLYARARISMQSRSRKSQGRGRRIANLFSGLGRCHTCEGKMTLRSKGMRILADGSTCYEDYLVCDNMQRGIIRENGKKCPNNVKYNYAIIENAVLDAILEDAVDDTHFADGSLAHQLSIEKAKLLLILERLEKKAKSTLDLLGEDDDDEYTKSVYREVRSEQKTIRLEIDHLSERITEAKGRVSPEEHTARIISLRAAMLSNDEDERFHARSTVRIAISELIREMRFHRKGPRVGLMLLNGARNITFTADVGRMTLDIAPAEINIPEPGLSDRQVRGRDRVLKSNLSRRRSESGSI